MRKLDNKQFVIDFKLPTELQRIIDKINIFANKYETDDDIPIDEYVAYILLLEELEITGKQYTSSGKITDTQKNLIFDKYNAWS